MLDEGRLQNDDEKDEFCRACRILYRSFVFIGYEEFLDFRSIREGKVDEVRQRLEDMFKEARKFAIWKIHGRRSMPEDLASTNLQSDSESADLEADLEIDIVPGTETIKDRIPSKKVKWNREGCIRTMVGDAVKNIFDDLELDLVLYSEVVEVTSLPSRSTKSQPDPSATKSLSRKPGQVRPDEPVFRNSSMEVENEDRTCEDENQQDLTGEEEDETRDVCITRSKKGDVTGLIEVKAPGNASRCTCPKEEKCWSTRTTLHNWQAISTPSERPTV